MTVLSADIGTSSLKAALINEDGLPLAQSRIPFYLYGTSHASTEWLSAFFQAVEKMRSSCCARSIPFTPDAVCISGNGPTVVSDDGTTLLWKEAISVESSVQTPSLFLPRIAFFKEQHFLSYRISKHLFSGPEFLLWQLTGRAVTILPEERFTPAYWTEADAFCSEQKIDTSKFPPFVTPGTFLGGLHCSIKSCPQDLVDLPVFAGSPDFVAALVGTNTLQEGCLCDRAGSSEGINLCTNKALSHPLIRTLPSVIPGLWNASVLLPDTGSRFSAYRQLVERTQGHTVSHADIVHTLLSDDTKDTCITDKAVLSQGKALIQDISNQIVQAVTTLTEEAQKAGSPLPHALAVTGGQASNAEWNAYKSKLTGLELHVPLCTDAELIGDAIFAFCGIKTFKNIKEAAQKLCKRKDA